MILNNLVYIGVNTDFVVLIYSLIILSDGLGDLELLRLSIHLLISSSVKSKFRLLLPLINRKSLV